MKYNKALDYAALAINASVKGKQLLAAKLFAKAAMSPDAADALRIIEASNGKAYADEQAARKVALEAAAAAKAATKTQAAKRVKASDAVGQDELVVDDEGCDDEELGADLVEEVMDNDEDTMTEDVPQEELAGDLDELDDEPDGDENLVDDSAAFAAVLASMKTKAAAKKAPAKK